MTVCVTISVCEACMGMHWPFYGRVEYVPQVVRDGPLDHGTIGTPRYLTLKWRAA